MIKALEGNTLGLALASVCGTFLLVCLLLIVLWALPPSADSGEEDSSESGLSGDIVALQSASALEEYAVVSQRPVFNEDRRPMLASDDTEPVDFEPGDDFEGRPDLELAGIVITPTMRVATLRSNEHEHSLVAFENKPLEGEFGTWQVTRIEERLVTLADDKGDEMQLELQVHDAMIAEPPKPVRPSEAPQAEAESVEGEQVAESEVSAPMTRAEEIRQRIEERREELRRAAEERDASQAQSYRDAIQSMIQDRSRENASEDEG